MTERSMRDLQEYADQELIELAALEVGPKEGCNCRRDFAQATPAGSKNGLDAKLLSRVW
jgi:hypothetical protein